VKQQVPAPPDLSYRPFPLDALPEPCRQFTREAAAAIGCDPSYVALPLLAGLAAAIGTTRRVLLKLGWCEPSLLWVAIVGESGTLKSPALDAALGPLRRAQAQALRDHAEAMRRYERDVQLYDADLAIWRSRGGGRSKGEPPPEAPTEPAAVRFIVADTTVEALAVVLADNPRGLLLERDELAGWLRGYDQYRAGKGGDVAHWLSMHRAGPVLVDRKSGARQTIYVPTASVGVCGGIQPGTLARALGQEHLEDGLAARLLLAMPPRAPRKWSEAIVDPRIAALVDAMFGELAALDWQTNADGQPCPIDVPLTASGKSHWIAWHDAHAHEQAELDGALASAWSKLEGYAARLALVVHLVRVAHGDPTLEASNGIDAVSMIAGTTLADWFGGEARRIYGLWSETDEQRDQRELIELLRRHGGRATARELTQWSRTYRGDPSGAEAALSRLVEARLARWESTPAGARGQPTRRCILSTVYGNTPSPEENGNTVDADNLEMINQRLMEAAKPHADTGN
jgi:hypothetical protein